jgi:hypothetical protein
MFLHGGWHGEPHAQYLVSKSVQMPANVSMARHA